MCGSSRNMERIEEMTTNEIVEKLEELLEHVSNGNADIADLVEIAAAIEDL